MNTSSLPVAGLAAAVLLAAALVVFVLRVPLRGRLLALALASPPFLACVSAGAFCVAALR